jgi:hypothetical protein
MVGASRKATRFLSKEGAHRDLNSVLQVVTCLACPETIDPQNFLYAIPSPRTG